MAKGRPAKTTPAPMPGGMAHVMPAGSATPTAKYAATNMPHPMMPDTAAQSTTDSTPEPGPAAKQRPVAPTS